MTFHRRRFILAIALSFVLAIGSRVGSQTLPSFNSRDRFHPVVADRGMVVTQEALAAEAGLAVLKDGGNAVDAAVTIGFALAATLPRAGNLGGGGFMLVHQAATSETVALDYREKAPQAATATMFLDENGEVDAKKARFSHLSVGVPGTVAGMIFALEKYGTISLERALKPAIELAENGFPISEDLSNTLRLAQERMQPYPASMETFFKKGGVPYERGDRFVQKDLARSLRLIAKEGRDAFYRGEIASAIAAEMEANGGLITKEDLAAYRPVLRQPIRGTYRGYEVYSMPPPSSGGIHLVQILNVLEGFPLQQLGHNTAQSIHLLAESMKLAYADRSKYLGDSDFVPVPIDRLISKAYASRRRTQIDPNRATPSPQILPGISISSSESNETTHYSVIDREGNAVANTYTLNFSYGTGITVPHTGILLNNEMDDFSANPGVPNAFGLIGGEFNAIEPEKRMLSSMSPTIVMKDGRPFLVTGSPGGSKIITTTLQVILNTIDYNMNIAEATNAVRVHHQWLPDRLQVEEDLNRDTVKLLEQKGHQVEVSNAMGSTQSIVKQGRSLFGAADPRRPGAIALGY